MSKIFEWIKNQKIYVKVVVSFLFFISIIVSVTISVTAFCIVYALFHPAEATIIFSNERVQEKFEEWENAPLDFEKLRPHIVPGVVLKIFDAQENLIFDTGGYYYPSNELFEKYLYEPPFSFLKENFTMSNINEAFVIRLEVPAEVANQKFKLYFYRTVTSQKYIFDMLEKFFLCACLMTAIFVFVMGEFVKRIILLPVKNLTDLAKKFSVANGADVKERITIPPANDELTELAKTFNEMLDKIQGDFKEIREALARKENFVSIVYHDIKEPLGIIDLKLQMIALYGDDSKSIASNMAAIESELKNAFGIVENYSLFTKMNDETFQPTKEILSLSEILSGVVNLAIEANNERDIQLLKNDSAQIFADKSLVVVLLRNILKNAIKYTKEGGTIQISSEVAGKNAVVKFRDNGIGIAKVDIEKIFSYGYRAKGNANVKKIEGCGIGLATSKMIADIHGIKIDGESVVGEGTTFTLTIPLV